MQTPHDLMSMQPCREAVAWLKQFKTLHTAWECCDRPEWLIWYLHKSGKLTRTFINAFGADCRKQVTTGEPKEVCAQIEQLIAEPEVVNSMDLVLPGQYALESSFVAIDFAVQKKRGEIERIRQCEFIRDLVPNPFS